MPSMDPEPTVRPPAPWPRFTRPADRGVSRASRPHDPSPHDPWPRWGWFPREQRTWTFAPGPALVADPVPAQAAPSAPAPPEAVAPPFEQPAAPAPDVEDPEASVDYLPVARPVTMALVPAGLGDVTLAEVARAARRAAPAAAVLGVAAVAAMAFFRRR